MSVVEASSGAKNLGGLIDVINKLLKLRISKEFLRKQLEKERSDYILYPATKHPDLNFMYGGLFVDILKRIAKRDPVVERLRVIVDEIAVGDKGKSIEDIPGSKQNAAVASMNDDLFMEVTKRLGADDVTEMCQSSRMFRDMCRKHRVWLASHFLRRDVLKDPTDLHRGRSR